MFDIIDIHCHPAMKVNFGHHITERHHPLPDIVPTGMHVDIPNMQTGHVRVAVSVHHIIEHGLLDVNRNVVLGILVRMLNLLNGPAIEHIFENKDVPGVTVANTLSSILRFEVAIQGAANPERPLSIPHTFAQFERDWQAGKTIFLHSLEGAHHLGNNETLAVYEATIEQYARAGVCQLTIAHFFENIIVSSQGGIPPASKHLLHYDEANVPRTFTGLNPHQDNIGEKLIHKLLDVGIIIDLVHCPPEARSRVYAINRERAAAGKTLRPLVFSHTGIQPCIDPVFQMLQADKDCLPSPEEVQEIIDCGGVIGVIFMNYWLVGKEEDSLTHRDNGLNFVVDTIKRLRELGRGSCTHIAIGSDLDGFSQVPDDLVTAAAMQQIPNALREAHFSDAQINQICSENYLRVLKAGWGEAALSM